MARADDDLRMPRPVVLVPGGEEVQQPSDQCLPGPLRRFVTEDLRTRQEVAHLAEPPRSREELVDPSDHSRAQQRNAHVGVERVIREAGRYVECGEIRLCGGP